MFWLCRKNRREVWGPIIKIHQESLPKPMLHAHKALLCVHKALLHERNSLLHDDNA